MRQRVLRTATALAVLLSLFTAEWSGAADPQPEKVALLVVGDPGTLTAEFPELLREAERRVAWAEC